MVRKRRRKTHRSKIGRFKALGLLSMLKEEEEED
jgi:hypothetical protein